MKKSSKALFVIIPIIVFLLSMKNGYILDAVYNGEGGVAVYAKDYGRNTDNVYFFDEDGSLLRTLTYDLKSKGSLTVAAEDTETVSVKHGSICEYYDFSGNPKQCCDGEQIKFISAPDWGITPFIAQIKQDKLFYQYISTEHNGISREIHLDRQLYYFKIRESVFYLIFTLIFFAAAQKIIRQNTEDKNE